MCRRVAEAHGGAVHLIDGRKPATIAIVTLLLALPLGYLCASRTTADLAYVAVFGHVYAFQTALLVMEWTNGSGAAFPQSSADQLLSSTIGYFGFTTAVYALGFGLVEAGHRLAARRARRAGAIQLDPAVR
jgi:hypothetical protein